VRSGKAVNHVICVGAQISKRVFKLFHLWKVCLISLTEIDELKNYYPYAVSIQAVYQSTSHHDPTGTLWLCFIESTAVWLLLGLEAHG
jgi:hypothetical protein